MATIAMTVAIAAWTVPAQGRMRATPRPRLDVCLADDAGREVTAQAETIASVVYDRIGVDLRWHATRCPADSILIKLQFSTPGSERPGALAYALVSDGTHIVVFYDRVLSRAPWNDQAVVGALYGHVLAHEICHILQGVARHSETGMMKAHWTAGDVDLMVSQQLRFTDEDVEMIHRGLEKRF
jgi:hypothetical protein